MSRYEEAKKIYAKFGVDTDAAIERLSNMGFAGVGPETAKVLMDTLNNLLM